MGPSYNHAYIHAKLIGALLKVGTYSVFSELTLDIDGADHVPDISLYPKRTINRLDDVIRVSEMPLLAVEILSPTQGTWDVLKKFKVYFQAGVKSCWLVEPVTSAVVVCSAPGRARTFVEDEIVDETLGLRVPIKEIFE